MLRFQEREFMDSFVFRLQLTQKWGVWEHFSVEVHPIKRDLCSLVLWFLPHILQSVGDLHCCMM